MSLNLTLFFSNPRFGMRLLTLSIYFDEKQVHYIAYFGYVG
jgi:hypothetical protein